MTRLSLPLSLCLFLSLCLSLCLLSPLVSGQGCADGGLELYSIYGHGNYSLDPQELLLNITTEAGVDNYTVTLTSAYIPGILWVVVQTQFGSSFTVMCNDRPVPGVFNYSEGGSLVQVEPFGANGAQPYSNNITITVSTPDCSTSDTFIVVNPAVGTDPPGVSGDPQFSGLRGQSFQVHGIDGAVYNLISDQRLQLNARFAFLSGPRVCPVMPSSGLRSGSCWSHPGSYLGELAVKTAAGDRIHISAGDAATGFAAVTLNSQPVAVGGELRLAEQGGLLRVNSSHELTLAVGAFTIAVESIDGFVNLRSVRVDSEQWGRLSSHGLLGQTHRNRRYDGKVKEIEGDVDDYALTDNDLFGDSFLFNRFQQ